MRRLSRVHEVESLYATDISDGIWSCVEAHIALLEQEGACRDICFRRRVKNERKRILCVEL